MKKLLLILLSALSLTAVAQKKSVAVLNPICRDNSVNNFYQQIVRGSMESAVTMTDEFVAFDRTAFDKVLEEHKFQQSGAVDDAQIRRMGVYAGVDLVLVTEVSAYDGYISVLVKILNIETGESSRGLSELMEQTPPIVQSSCKELARKVFGIVDFASRTRKGTLSLPEGQYEGEIKNGRPHGKGTLFYNEEKKRKLYTGDWVNGVQSGEGIIEWKNGTRYEGHIENNKAHGYGVFFYLSGGKYEGYFKDGEPNGFGKRYYAKSGGIDEGFFVDGKCEGRTTHYFSSGTIDKGKCINNKREGEWIRIYSDGTKEKAIYSNGEIIEDWH